MYPQADTLPMSYIPLGVLSVNTYKSTALVKWMVSQLGKCMHPQADTLPMSYIPFVVLSVNTYKSTALVKWMVR